MASADRRRFDIGQAGPGLPTVRPRLGLAKSPSSHRTVKAMPATSPASNPPALDSISIGPEKSTTAAAVAAFVAPPLNWPSSMVGPVTSSPRTIVGSSSRGFALRWLASRPQRNEETAPCRNCGRPSRRGHDAARRVLACAAAAGREVHPLHLTAPFVIASNGFCHGASAHADVAFGK